MRRHIPLYTDEIYHLYNRGVDRRNIFLDDKDYERFQLLLYLANGERPINCQALLSYGRRSLIKLYNIDRGKPLVAISSYVLMPNHFHVLVYQLVDNGISQYMKKLLTAYAKYFNTKHKRTGVLFQSRFRSVHVNTDTHLRYLYSYIHLNPVKLIQSDWQIQGIRDTVMVLRFLKKYQYSSYLDHINPTRPTSAILNTSCFPDYFSSPEIYTKEIFLWLTIKDGLP